MSKHLFAIYIVDFSKNYNSFEIEDSVLYHRILRVLRLEKDSEIIVFDKVYNSVATIKEIKKRSIIFSAQSLEKNKIIEPEITLAVGLLKKENLEELAYAAVELGINNIQPLITEKSQRSNLSTKDRERLEKIMISAAEQSKNYSMSNIQEPMILPMFLKKCDSEIKLYFDIDGYNISDLASTSIGRCSLLVGPEGDFSDFEKKQILEYGFIKYKLTPTILTAVDAAIIGSGLIRSIFNK